MFEGITTAQWLGFMATGAGGASLIALVRRRSTALMGLALWLVAPGLLFTALSIVPNARTFAEIFFLMTVFTGIPWGVAAVPSFLLVRLVMRWRRRGARAEQGAG